MRGVNLPKRVRRIVGLEQPKRASDAVIRRTREASGLTSKNITVAVDEETYRLARVRAAELDTSVPALVRNYLRSLKPKDDVISNKPRSRVSEQRKKRILDTMDAICANHPGFEAADNLPRDELYDRASPRTGIEEDRSKGD